MSKKNNDLSREEIGVIANKILSHLEGLNKPNINNVLNWVNIEIERNYLLSVNPIKPGKS